MLGLFRLIVVNKLANSLIIGKKNFFLLNVLRINVGMKFIHKNNQKGNNITIVINNSCGKIFIFKAFSNHNFLQSPEPLQVFLKIINL